MRRLALGLAFCSLAYKPVKSGAALYTSSGSICRAGNVRYCLAVYTLLVKLHH